MPPRILVIEDEELIAESLRLSLQKEGFEVLVASDGDAGLAAAQRDHPDAIILDILLPGMNGFDVCREIRRGSDVPILMLTARGDEVDRVVGLELGADDSVVKPFSMRELIARVRARLRRPHAGTQTEAALLRSGDLEMDIPGHVVTRAGHPLRLNPKEFDLLKALMAHREQVLDRETLLDTVWGKEEYRDPRKVDVHIRWLRAKIEDDPASPRRILTIHGLGYKFVE